MRTTLTMDSILRAVQSLMDCECPYWVDTLYPIRGTCIAWNEL